MKAAYAKLLVSGNDDNDKTTTSRSILVEIEKLFFRIERHLRKCHQFSKSYCQHESSSAASVYVTLAPSLLYRLDENVHAFYSSVFLAKKIQLVRTLVENCLNYQSFLFPSSTAESSSSFNLDGSFLLPIRTFVSEFVAQMLTGLPTVIIGNLIDVIKNEPLDMNLNEQLNVILARKLATGQIDQSHLTHLNQIVIVYDRVWSEMDLMERIDSSLRLKNRCLNCFKVVIIYNSFF